MSKDTSATKQQKKAKKSAERQARKEDKAEAEAKAERAAKRRHSLKIALVVVVIAVAVVVVLFATGIVGVEFTGIYVMSSVTVYEDGEATTTTYDIDEHGGIEAASQTSDDGDVQDVSYVLDEYGFYTTCTYTIEDDDGEEVEMTELREITEADDDGRPLEIESSTYYDGELYYQELIEYTYHEDSPDVIESISTTSSAGYEVLMEYGEDGFLIYYEISWPDATSETSSLEYTYETNEDGTMTCTTVDEDGEETVYEYELDRHGNVTTVTQDGETVYEYEYTVVGEPYYVEAAIAGNRRLAGPII